MQASVATFSVRELSGARGDVCMLRALPPLPDCGHFVRVGAPAGMRIRFLSLHLGFAVYRGEGLATLLFFLLLQFILFRQCLFRFVASVLPDARLRAKLSPFPIEYSARRMV